MPLPQYIQDERDDIGRIGQAIADQKDQHLINFTPIPVVLTLRLLTLVSRIAQHDIDHRTNYGNETAQRRRANLGNLALTFKLFHDGAGLMEYNIINFYKASGALQGYINTNLFDDMKYLATYKLAATTTPLVELRDISDATVARILDAISSVFVEIANREIDAIQLRQANPNFFQQGLPANIVATRNMYKDHRNTTELYYFIMYEKETRKLTRALQAIQDAQTINVDIASPFENKRAFLKCLVVIGEAFTQPNLTPQSRSLSNLAQRDLQLFKNLRNKIADSQYDLQPQHVEAYIAANSLGAIKAELGVLIPQLTTIRTQLQVMQQNNQLAAHYGGPLAPVAEHVNERFTHTRAFFGGLPQTNGTYRQDKIAYPNDFTSASIAQKVQDEIGQIIALTNVMPGEGTLADPRFQNQHTVTGDIDTFLTNVSHVNANVDAELEQAIATIRIRSPQVNAGNLVVQFPTDILARYFPAQQYPNGYSLHDINLPFIQNNRVALFPLIKQYARRLEFIHHLNTNPICKNAIEYHFGRMARYLMEIPNDGIENHIGADNLAQWRSIRNLIQHDLEELETYGNTISQWLCHYLGIVTQDLPNMLRRLQPPAVVMGPLP